MTAADTIFALSSGKPPAAIAIIRISGSTAHAIGRQIAAELPGAREAAVRALRDPRSGELLDEAMVLRFDAPGTATGEDVVEFHCHGSRGVVDGVLSAIRCIEGAREAQPGEFTRRAFENGRIDLIEAEGLADLLEAETEAQRRAALRLAEGDLSRQVAAWSERILGLSARAERAIDYAEEDEDGARGDLATEAQALAAELGEWLKRPRAEPLREGLKVVVAGPPNAGKSSLINAIAGVDRIIVSDSPGTTRDVVEVPLAMSGIALVLTDTAGIRDSDDPIEAEGVLRARARLADADILLWLGNPIESPEHPGLLLIHAKADLGLDHGRGGLPVSSKTGQGLAELGERLVGIARTMVPSGDDISLNRRQARHVEETFDELVDAARARDAVLQAEHLRLARTALDRMTGRAGVEEMLDALFSRFCLGK